MAFERYDPEYPYLGPNSWPQMVRRSAPYWRTFNRPAYFHDKFFSEGGSPEDLERANRVFCVMCRIEANKDGRVTVRFFSEFYPSLTDRFGKYFFRFKITLRKP